ncbi:hypothetical protein [Algoriphagus sp. AK58]|uniref:hypothetical protein n=1 Tax=Algoriphagus sp. AK58 TaxID=1406877 RepID=UPI0016509E7A|nr:hypothetical protein [Algoriphagus sp. AK58]MBC6368524.1 hypothetical protein [Algoriphagus sp. AK58]
MSYSKPNNRIHLILVTENMRWFLGIILFIVSFGAFPVGPESTIPQEKAPLSADFPTEVLDVFQFDFSELVPAEARVRSSSSSSQRLKNERVLDTLEAPGLIFLSCRIAKSYSEIHIDTYLKLLFQYTIQVNAP